MHNIWFIYIYIYIDILWTIYNYCNQNVIIHVSYRMQYCIHCILHICNIQYVIIVTCHNIMNNVYHFDGQMYVLSNINIKYIFKYLCPSLAPFNFDNHKYVLCNIYILKYWCIQLSALFKCNIFIITCNYIHHIYNIITLLTLL